MRITLRPLLVIDSIRYTRLWDLFFTWVSELFQFIISFETIFEIIFWFWKILFVCFGSLTHSSENIYFKLDCDPESHTKTNHQLSTGTVITRISTLIKSHFDIDVKAETKSTFSAALNSISKVKALDRLMALIRRQLLWTTYSSASTRAHRISMKHIFN